MNTCIAGHRGVRDGVIHTGAVALMLGAALAMSSARAADNDIDRDSMVRRPVPPAQPAPIATPAAPPAPAERAVPGAPAARAEAEKRMHDAQKRMEDAEERMSRAAAEFAAIAAERASEALENLPSFIDAYAPRRTVIGVDLDAQSKEGARVLDVSPGGPAEQAGIRTGDVIVMVDGKNVEGDGTPGAASRIVARALRGLQPDTKVKVRVLRDGKANDFEVVARPMANAFAFRGPQWQDSGVVQVSPFNFNYDDRLFGSGGDLAGLEVTALTPQLGRYFGASKGVLIVRAPKSDVYKLQDGDVILSIDGREPTSGSHVTRILSSYQPGEELTLRVIRDHKTQDIKVTIPKRNRQSGVRPTWGGEPM